MSGPAPSLLVILPVALAGATMLFLPGLWRDRANRLYAAKVAERERRGHDAYFEEARTLKAYRPWQSAAAIRAGGLALVLLAALGLYLRLYS